MPTRTRRKGYRGKSASRRRKVHKYSELHPGVQEYFDQIGINYPKPPRVEKKIQRLRKRPGKIGKRRK